MEKDIYNWIYKFDPVTGFEIIPNEPHEKPKVLSKLYSLNHNSVDALINQYVYATHPWQLNDLFDCNEELLNFDDETVVRNILKNIIPKDKLNKRIRENFNNLKVLVQRNFREITYRKWGIFSMTGNPNNVLMWSYYGNNKGFCIEFDITQFPFEYYGPFPINYQPELKALSIKEIGVQIGVLAQCNLKDKIWEHESEWRLMIVKPKGQDLKSPAFKFLKDLGGHDRRYHYPITAIRSIALANKFFEPDEIKDVNNTELEINLYEDIEYKSLVLNFISDHKILAFLGLRTGFTTIKFRKVSFNKTDKSGQYKVNAC